MKRFSQWLEQRDRFYRPAHGGYAGKTPPSPAGDPLKAKGYDRFGMPIRDADSMITRQAKGKFLDVANSVRSIPRKGIPGVPGSGAVNRFLFGPNKVVDDPSSGAYVTYDPEVPGRRDVTDAQGNRIYYSPENAPDSVRNRIKRMRQQGQ